MGQTTVTLKESSAYNFDLENDSGSVMKAQSKPAMSGVDDSFRPMEMLLGAIAACSSIDLRLILEKQRQRIDDIEITVEGKREDSKVPASFQEITLHYNLTGNIDATKAKKAVELALYKYCSVQKHLAGLAKIDHTLKVQHVD